MKKKRHLLTWEDLLELEDKYFPDTLGNLLSLGAAHFRPAMKKNGRKQSRPGHGASHRRTRKAVTA
jgi:hypothetical protein